VLYSELVLLPACYSLVCVVACNAVSGSKPQYDVIKHSEIHLQLNHKYLAWI